MQSAEYYNLATVERTHWWYLGMAAIAADWLRQLPRVPGGRILDVGCGTGEGLQWLAEFGCVYGLDRHPLALQLASRSDRGPLVQADVGSLPFPDASFSIATAFDVLYHQAVADDGVALRDLARVLQPCGWLLLRVPAYDWLRGAHDKVVHTRRRYTRREVRSKLINAGFKPVRITYVNSLLLLPVLVWRLVQRMIGCGCNSDVRQLPVWANGLLKAVLNLERSWLRRFNLPVGLSVLALARKRDA